jgi:hypothetical protein
MKCHDVHGNKVSANNSNRMVWSSVRCTYWTDNWDNLKTIGAGIPVCPHCQSVGYESVYSSFDRSAKRHDENVSEGYYTFLQEMKEKCVQSKDGKPIRVADAFRMWRDSNGKALLSDCLTKGIESGKIAG